MNLNQEIEDIKKELGVTELVIEANPTDIEAQTALGGKVGFLEALKLALISFLEDGSDGESPVGCILVDPGGFDLPQDKDELTGARELVKSWLNQSESQLFLCNQETEFLPEYGESIEENWIFWLSIPKHTPILHWAIVDRSGNKAAYNYGFG